MSVTLAVLAVGCGSSGPTTTSSGSKQNAGKDPGVTAAFAYARCMRSHGVSDFPDPKIVTSPGTQAIMFHLNRSDARSPRFKTASRACQSILPAPSGSSAEQRQARKAGLLGFARCMRAKGIAGFPDPDVHGELTVAMVRAAGIDVRSQKVQEVAKSCVPASHGALSVADVERAASGGQ